MKLQNLFKIMLNTPSKGIYCLINHRNKRVYLKYSQNICMSLSRVLADIRSKNTIYKQLIKDVKKLQFLYLEDININEDDLSLHLKLDFYVQKYMDLGYSLYNNKHKLARFKVAIEVTEDLKSVHVVLTSRNRKKRIVVGVFDKMYDAEEFAASFDAMDVIRPIYAVNELSRKYFLNESNQVVK